MLTCKPRGDVAMLFWLPCMTSQCGNGYEQVLCVGRENDRLDRLNTVLSWTRHIPPGLPWQTPSVSPEVPCSSVTTTKCAHGRVQLACDHPCMHVKAPPRITLLAGLRRQVAHRIANMSDEHIKRIPFRSVAHCYTQRTTVGLP